MADHDEPLLTSSEIEESPSPISTTSESSSINLPSLNRSVLHRSSTAPAMAAIMAEVNPVPNPNLRSNNSSSGSIFRHASLLLLLYLSLGVLTYTFNPNAFSGIETHPIIDALYFCVVTLCTIGYGDIAPLTPITKLLSCVFVLIGFGFIEVLLSGAVNRFLDHQETQFLTSIIRHGTGPSNYIFDAEKGRMRIRMKVLLAISVVILCIAIGASALSFLEGLDFMDSLYLSVMSVTTVGYGDHAFKTMKGRVFACLWLLISTLAVAKSFIYLAEARINKRHKRIAKWSLHRNLTVEDLLAADLNHNGFISKSEYAVFKLREMGIVKENDVLQICDQFNKLDCNNTGKITLIDLLNYRKLQV
ncbi:LOW QUALITY PROTEIN: two-pore potassium channel 5-like [Dioscorea cayenensis subsp. rotundata]|uniref:LOW QUALITY PROTEIN: two-pore potassium channel 5-like n=1 Tax=Dioscorea cayennensis subsp. rotundata TaxID=55577 RepID=A0AB40BPI1_DIOCR|nr:LOW QUALITY PROTEIN: two-pore potassium channel 5-like [Dioscorea cayenensis subsp. rotundata]